MTLERRLSQLETLVQRHDGPSEAEYKAAQERHGHRAWAWSNAVLEAAGIEAPSHCRGRVEEARAALGNDTQARRDQDTEIVREYAEARGRGDDGIDHRQRLFDELRLIAERRGPDDDGAPVSMADAVSRALFPAAGVLSHGRVDTFPAN